MISGRVLVLNRNWQPVRITSVRRAVAMLYIGVARAIDEDGRAFDFDAWCERDATDGAEAIRSVSFRMVIPRVVVLHGYAHVPRHAVRLCRQTVFVRDGHTCQYCHRRFPRAQLNLDHVVPRSRGGGTSWRNVVCSCVRCNLRKGGRTPEQAGMRLLREPRPPRWSPLLTATGTRIYAEWLPFLGPSDRALLAAAEG